jgi:hypothetical protein
MVTSVPSPVLSRARPGRAAGAVAGQPDADEVAFGQGLRGGEAAASGPPGVGQPAAEPAGQDGGAPGPGRARDEERGRPGRQVRAQRGQLVAADPGQGPQRVLARIRLIS